MANRPQMIEAKDIIQQAMGSGSVVRWHVDNVYEKDGFEYESGANPKLVHKPDPFADEKDRGKYLGSYSVVTLKNGAILFEVMPAKDVYSARDQSKRQGGPWKTWFGEMAKKCVLKRHAKRFNTSDAVQGLIDQDNDEYGLDLPARGEPDPVGDMKRRLAKEAAEAADTSEGTAKINAKIKADAEKYAPTDESKRVGLALSRWRQENDHTIRSVAKQMKLTQAEYEGLEMGRRTLSKKSIISVAAVMTEGVEDDNRKKNIRKALEALRSQE